MKNILMKILLVDDEPAGIVVLRDYLFKKGYESDLAFDGKQALRRLREVDYDLVIVDFEMPEINGIELVKEMKQNQYRAKIIMMTGYDLMDDFMALSTGVDEFLTKPYSLQKVSELIEKYNPTKTVLIVEDDHDILELLKHRLNAHPYHLVFADEGNEALKLAIQVRPDLIVLDHFLPGLSGEEVCKTLREHENEEIRRIPILMLSGKASLSDRVNSRVLGANVYLTKPFETQEFVKTVQHLLHEKESGKEVS